jgi:UDPglucose 6-dehydrogenase
MQEKLVQQIRVYDPSGMPMFQSIFPASEQIAYVTHEFEAIQSADVIIIATDWPQFRGLADVIIAEIQKKPLIMDGRRMLQHRYGDLAEAGCDILAVGSPFISKQ